MIIVICGTSGAGKDTVAAVLSEVYGAERIISVTTREELPRDAGTNQYQFVTDEEFNQMVSDDLFAEYTEYIGNGDRYGTLKETVEAYQGKTRLAYKVCDIKGYHKLKELYPDDVYGVNLYLPKEHCRQRMIARGDDPVSIEARLLSWEKETHDNLSADHSIEVTNYTLEQMSTLAHHIMRSTGHLAQRKASLQ